MDRNKIKILIIMIITILILLVLWLMFFRNRPQPAKIPVLDQDFTEQALPKQIDDGPVILEPRPEKELAPLEYGAEDLKMMAFSFAERLGSYSNQASFANITELKIFMTPSMQEWADSYVAKMKKDFEYSGQYEGVSTRALTGTINDFDMENRKAEILVRTQKTKTNEQGEEVVYQEYLTIRYVFLNNKWLVDYAKWQE